MLNRPSRCFLPNDSLGAVRARPALEALAGAQVAHAVPGAAREVVALVHGMHRGGEADLAALGGAHGHDVAQRRQPAPGKGCRIGPWGVLWALAALGGAHGHDVAQQR
jgi:hypothetical protein